MKFPPEYLADIERMALQLRNAKRAGLELRFRMAPRGIMIVCDLGEHGDLFALSEDARTLIRMFVKQQGRRGATYIMLLTALDSAQISYATVGLAELGLAGRG